MGSASESINTEVLIIGGGFGGIYALHQLRDKLGLQTVLVEAGSDFGGVWYWNRYPGARVDSEAPFYQLSVHEVWKDWNFTQRFPDDAELRRYFAHADRVLNLRKDAVFNTVIEGVSWADGRWTANTTDGRQFKCKYLILATGSSYKKHYPDFPNMRSYKGELIHAADMPRHKELDFKSKRVAVIGNGSTGLQIVQELAREETCQLTSYIRTPNIAFPMDQRVRTEEEENAAKSFYEALFTASKTCKGGFPYNQMHKSWAECDDAERLARLEELWNRGGFGFLIGNYKEMLLDKEVNAFIYDFWVRRVRSRMRDGPKRDIVAPLKQAQFIGTKRPGIEHDYYEALDRPNVEIVNLLETPIQTFTEEGIDGRQYDMVFLATGYDALTGSLLDLQIRDKNGVLLQDKWKKGTFTWLGLGIDGMPNMFMVYSPQAPTSLSNGPPIIEIQVDWIRDAIEKMQRDNIDNIEPRFEAADKWRQGIQDLNNKTLYPLANSWYMGANVPGKPREQLVYLAGVDVYNKACREALQDWNGFEVTYKA